MAQSESRRAGLSASRTEVDSPPSSPSRHWVVSLPVLPCSEQSSLPLSVPHRAPPRLLPRSLSPP